MAEGVIYLMSTFTKGLIKIGKTQTSQFESRMTYLENNGYANITGLKRRYAIKIENYDEIEVLLMRILKTHRVGKTELFSFDIDTAIELLSSLRGTQIYPRKEENEKQSGKSGKKTIPDGTYYFNRRIVRWNNREITGIIVVRNNRITLKAGSMVCPLEGKGRDIAGLKKYDNVPIKDNILVEDVEMSSISAASSFLVNAITTGDKNWRTKDGMLLKDLL